VKTGRTTESVCKAGMGTFIALVISLVIVSGGVFYGEQRNPPKDVTNVPGVVFIFGLLVRMALTVVMLTLSAIVVSTLFSAI
jgi:hypothetical protein